MKKGSRVGGGDGKAASKVHFFDAGGCTGGLSGDVAGGGVLSRDVKEEHTEEEDKSSSPRNEPQGEPQADRRNGPKGFIPNCCREPPCKGLKPALAADC